MDDLELLQVDPTVEAPGASPDAPSLETPPDDTVVVEDQIPEGMSEAQLGNWKALREAKEAAATRATTYETELSQFKSKIEPIEPAFDALVELGTLMSPLQPDGKAIQEKIATSFPVADQYLAGHYLRQWGDWYVQQLTGGEVQSAAALTQFIEAQRQGGQRVAPQQQGYTPQQTPVALSASDPRLQEQLAYLDPDLRAAIESQLKTVDQLSKQVQGYTESQQKADAERFEAARYAKESEYITTQGQTIDELLKVAKVEPVTPEGTPNRTYARIKGLVALEMSANPRANELLDVGKQAHALGQTVTAYNCSRELKRMLNETFTSIANDILKPVQQATLAAQGRIESQATTPSKAVLTGASVPSVSASTGKREYSSNPEERRKQLASVVSGFFGKK